MEPAGLAVLVVGLIGLFSTVFDMYDKIESIRGMDRVLQEQHSRLTYEMKRVEFLTLEEIARQLRGVIQAMQTHAPELRGELAALAAAGGSSENKDSEKNQIEDKASENSHIENEENTKRPTWIDSVRQNLSFKSINQNTSNDDNAGLKADPPPPSRTPSPLRQLARLGLGLGKIKRHFRWAAAGQRDLNNRIGCLHSAINSLWDVSMTAPVRVRSHFLLRADALREPDTAAAMLGAYPSVARAARVRQLLLAQLEPAPESQGAAPGNASSYTARHRLDVAAIGWQEPGNLSLAVTRERAMGLMRGSPVLVEWRQRFHADGYSGPAAERRLDKLCELLNAMHAAGADDAEEDGGRTVGFAQLECAGWTLADVDDKGNSNNQGPWIGLVFHWPFHARSAASLQPQLLRDRIKSSRQPIVSEEIPALGERFDLAFGLACAVANIILVGWTHRSVRSGNLVSFSTKASRLYLIGFTYACPAADDSPDRSYIPRHVVDQLYHIDIVSAEGVVSVTPDNRTGPDFDEMLLMGRQRESDAAHDLYSLGIVLLEIGRWLPAQDMVNFTGIPTRKKFRAALPELVHGLAAECGAMYRDVVQRCLNPKNWRADKVTENLGDMLERLSRCRA